MDPGPTTSLNRRILEEIRYSEADFILPSLTWQERKQYTEDKEFLSAFDTALRSKWAEKMKQGLFRYPLWNLQTRILTGRVKYVAQLNIKRGTERRKPQDIVSIQEKFNPSQFNFNKIRSEEILFEMVRDQSGKVAKKEKESSASNHVPPNTTLQKSLVVINVSPLEFGHVLLIPDPSLCLNQILIPDIMLFGLESILLSGHPGFRVGFNSLGGFASVNHLHLHGFYLDEELLIESAPSRPLCTAMNFYLLADFPAPGFFFYTDNRDLVSVSRRICRVTDYLVHANIAHNVFLTRGHDPGEVLCPESREGIRVVIWPRKSCFGAKEESAFNVALCELAGHLPFKNKDDYAIMTEEAVISIIKEYLFSDEDFNALSVELVEHLTS